jgi:hypothetical protein
LPANAKATSNAGGDAHSSRRDRSSRCNRCDHFGPEWKLDEDAAITIVPKYLRLIAVVLKPPGSSSTGVSSTHQGAAELPRLFAHDRLAGGVVYVNLL